VLKFFPEQSPAEPSENLKAMKVRDLLTMSCGHDTEPKRGTNGPAVKDFLAHPVPHKPGTHFLYNTMGSYTVVRHCYEGDGADIPGIFEAAFV
jgi:CubicO group peptidase (beta-lactamase class C family)